MNTATAKAKEVVGSYTALEILQAVEEFQISLSPPARTGRWLAVYGKIEERMYAFGDSAVAAVEELLRQIGGVNG